MTPEEEALRLQVDALFEIPDDGWVDDYLAALDVRDSGKPADEPDHNVIVAMDRYTVTPEGAQALLERMDPPRQVMVPRDLAQEAMYEWQAAAYRARRAMVALGLLSTALLLHVWGIL